MARQDDYLAAMLRHLGAAYYESQHGRATRSDVIRALDTVEEHLGEQAAEHDAAAGEAATPRPGDEPQRVRLRARRVRDLMTTSVVTADRATTFKEIASLLSEHGLSGLPVLVMGRRVGGVVTESDLLAAKENMVRRVLGAGAPRWRVRPRAREHLTLTAGELMTSPAITIGPDASPAAAARLMNAHHVRRLPVVSDDGVLVGIISRRDLLRAFLHPDTEIAADARHILREFSLGDLSGVTVTVRGGVVTISGSLQHARGQDRDLIPAAIRLIGNIDGVVNVVNRLGEAGIGGTPDPPPAGDRQPSAGRHDQRSGPGAAPARGGHPCPSACTIQRRKSEPLVRSAVRGPGPWSLSGGPRSRNGEVENPVMTGGR
jgi:CBS domain-containing protein